MSETLSDKQGYRQPVFWICAGLLAVCGLGLSRWVQSAGGVLRKEPLPLQRSLQEMDRQALLPYQIVRDIRIEDRELLKSLGTEDYVQWVMENTEATGHPAVEQLLAFITYYPLPDRVPHVPEECYLGSGYQPLASEHVTLHLDDPALPDRIEAKYLVFERTEGGLWYRNRHVPVVYLFKVNGEYVSDREQARLVLNKNLLGKSSYFSKVELVFNMGTESPNQDQVLATATHVFQVLLPVLEKEHWPQFP